MRVLGIEVDERRLASWREWVMPERQPYLVPRETAERLGSDDRPDLLTGELRDSFRLYGTGNRAVVWADRREARALPAEMRRAQPWKHLWRSADERRDRERVVRFVENGRRSSRHREVGAGTWRRAGRLLPGIGAPVIGFPDRSGPNCFGTVLGLSGVAGAERGQVGPDAFEAWLARRTVPGARPDGLGTVLVWRNTAGGAEHAALVLGDGFALHKGSQGWMSPVLVLTVREMVHAHRVPGWRLHRYRLTGADSRQLTADG